MLQKMLLQKKKLFHQSNCPWFFICRVVHKEWDFNDDLKPYRCDYLKVEFDSQSLK